MPRTTSNIVTCSLLSVVLAGSARGQEISWVAVGADGPFTLGVPNAVGEPTRIILDAGVRYRVEFEIRVNGWGDAAGNPTLGTFQGTLDATGLLGANADPPAPGINLQQINEAPYGGFTGAFIRLATCNDSVTGDSTGQRCDVLDPPLPPCPAGMECGDNPDFVFAGILNQSFVGTATANYAWAAVSQFGSCRTDEGIGYYGATFVFDVPSAAKGVYEFGFDPDAAWTFLNNCAGTKIMGVVHTPGSVELTTGACCTSVGGGGVVCLDNVAFNDCASVWETFFKGKTCDEVACCGCNTNDDCADESMCTRDLCVDPCYCVNELIYDPATECCDPVNGQTVPLDDGDVCTADYCDTQSGQPYHSPSGAAGRACVDDNPCTVGGACDGIHSEADGGCVGDPIYDVDTECCAPSTGVIRPYNSATQCCVLSTGQIIAMNDGDVCTDDSCDAAGLPTHDPAGALGVTCNDGSPCTINDVCDGIFSYSDGGCSGEPGYDVGTECCDPSTGVIEPYNASVECCYPPTGLIQPISDSDTCTVDSCGPTGWPVHLPDGTVGLACDDGSSCTVDDMCDGISASADGGCVGRDINGDPCATDGDCLAGTCNIAAGVCKCTDLTPRAAPYPHDRLKNRYISFAPGAAAPAGTTVAFQIELKSIGQGSCSGADSAPCRYPQAGALNCGYACSQIPSVSCCTIDDCIAANAGICNISNDCRRCSQNQLPCISAAVDCLPNTESCDLSGEMCFNNRPATGGTNVGLIRWVGPENNGRFLAVTETFREERPAADWPPVIHVGDCEIVPQAVYGIRALDVAAAMLSDELLVSTQVRPANGVAAWWGDSVGSLAPFCNGDIRAASCNDAADCAGDPCVLAWTPPDGSHGFNEIAATVALFQASGGVPVAPYPPGVPPAVDMGSYLVVRPDVTWLDLHGDNAGAAAADPPNARANFADIHAEVLAFQGRPYPYLDPADCPDVGEWP